MTRGIRSRRDASHGGHGQGSTSSDSYYDIEQMLVGREDSVGVDATSVVELFEASLGVFWVTASVASGSASEYVAAAMAVLPGTLTELDAEWLHDRGSIPVLAR